MTALISVNLALTKLLSKNGYTIDIFSYPSENLKGLFDDTFLERWLGDGAKDYVILIILALIVIALKILVDLFLKTKMGYMLRATGDNEKLVISLGRDAGMYKILGIAIANGFTAVSGALYAQLFNHYDNTSGSGKVVQALTSVIIGLAVFSGLRFMKGTTSVIFGAIFYSLCLNYLVLVDTDGIYLKLWNAVMFMLILIFNEKISGFLTRRSHTEKNGGLPHA